jgi:pimeloyl-ACP methyl ester carboxylesterase
MIVGAPPIPPNGWAHGFIQSPLSSLAASPQWSPEDADAFLLRIYGRVPEPRLRAAALRADGRMRKQLFEAARAGVGVDQRRMVETSTVPLAVVNGGADALIVLDYFDTVAYANLWEGRCHRLADLGHAPFWEAPAMFTPVLERFLRDIRSGRLHASS